MSIVLDAPRYLSAPATEVDPDSVIIVLTGTGGITINYSWKAADGKKLQSDSLSITGADLQALMAAKVAAGDVGQTIISILRKGLNNKLKTMLGLTGTVQ